MPNPIILIFEYHQVPAGEHLFQNNFHGLLEHGYKTYMDEEASDITLEKKHIASNDLVIQSQNIQEGSKEFWQKEIVAIRKKTIDLLVQNQFNYHAYDLPADELQILLIKNIDLIRSHPKGIHQGANDLLSGKIPDHKEAYDRRVQFQNEEFIKHALKAKDGVICIAGIYHANHLQTYLRNKFPGQDILSFFPYQGAPFEAFEVDARNPETNLSIFPHNARLIDMEQLPNQGQNIIIEDLVNYKNLVDKLEEIDRLLNKEKVSKEKLDDIQNDLFYLKNNCQKLTSLNNVEIYLFAIDVYLLKCAMENKDLHYIKTNYNSIKKNGDSLEKTEFKERLIQIVKEIVIQYRTEQKIEKVRIMESNYNPGFFIEGSGTQSDAGASAPQPK